MRLVGCHRDPRSYDDGSVRPGDDRAELKAGDFGQVVGESRDPQQQVAQVRPPRGNIPDQLVRVDSGQRREPGPNITSAPKVWSAATLTITSVPPARVRTVAELSSLPASSIP